MSKNKELLNEFYQNKKYDDEYGILPYIRRCLEKQHHCIVVTSEGITIPGLEGDVMNILSFH